MNANENANADANAVSTAIERETASGFEPIRWMPSADGAGEAKVVGVCRLLDQTRLPSHEVYVDVRSVEEMFDAIRQMVVRGAPAIGIAAGYGVVLGVTRDGSGPAADLSAARDLALKAADRLAQSRPTAVNLFWALDRMRAAIDNFCAAHTITATATGADLAAHLLAQAYAIHREDGELCVRIGRAGAELIEPNMGVLTHCNAGALATGGIGTALGVIRTAWEAGKRFSVFACETRPLLQGARLTAWELMRVGVDVTLIADSMAGHAMQRDKIGLVIVGADRIAANGDTANKIGTYAHAVLAHHHRIPFYVAAPLTTFDPTLPDGSGIPIEERSADEIANFAGIRTAPADIKTFAPAFDVTPAELIAGIITEVGILRPPFRTSIAAAFAPTTP